MTAPKRYFPAKLLLLVAALAVILLAVYLTPPSDEPEPDNPSTSQPPSDSPVTQKKQDKPTIASAWQWPETGSGSDIGSSDEPARDEDSDFPFTADSVYDALQDVRLDKEGNVILDNRALEALNDTFRHGRVELRETDLEALQELIRVGLPGPAGEQTARIVGDYYGYLEARDRFTANFGSSAGDSPEAMQQQYEELRALRDSHLGQEVSRELFRTEDASARYMLEAQKVATDPDLSQEEKIQRSRELNQELEEAMVPVENWTERKQQFNQERQQILEAGLAEQEKQTQIESLRQRHFSDQELEQLEEHNIDGF